MGQGTTEASSITIYIYELDKVHQITYLGSIIDDTLTEPELNRWIGRALTISRLVKIVWNNIKLIDHARLQENSVCIVNTLFYGNETWTLYLHQERRLASFHMSNLRIFNHTCKDKAPTSNILEHAEIQSCSQSSDNGTLDGLSMFIVWIIVEYLYGGLESGKRPTGHPHLQFQDVCKQDLKACINYAKTLNAKSQNHNGWKQELRYVLKTCKEDV